MVVVAVIISVVVPVCVVKHAKQHGEVTLDSEPTTCRVVDGHMTVMLVSCGACHVTIVCQ